MIIINVDSTEKSSYWMSQKINKSVDVGATEDDATDDLNRWSVDNTHEIMDNPKED